MYSVNAPSKARKCRSNGVSFTLRQLWHLLASFPGHVAWPGNEAKSKLSMCDYGTPTGTRIVPSVEFLPCWPVPSHITR